MAVVVPIISSFDSRGIDRAIRQFSKLETSAEKAAFGLRVADQAATKMAVGFAKIAAAGAVVGAVVGKQLIDAASSLAESQSKVNVVFGDSAKAVTDFADTAASKMGISKQAALEAAGTFGNLIQAFGLGQSQAQEMSTTLVQLASDLASFNNTSTEDAIQALRSGLSGETEPLKKYGVALNDVRLKQEAMTLGLYDGKGALDITAKTQAAYALILKDTALAQGDYARTADGVANMQRTLQASFQDVKAEIGTALIPIYQALLGFLQQKVLPVFSEFGRILGEQGVGAAFKYLGGQILGSIANLGKFGTAVYALTAALVILRAATIAQTITLGVLNVANTLAKAGFLGTTVGVYALNAAMKANPISLVVAAVVALIAAIGFLLIKFGLLQKAFGAIKAIGGAVIGFMQRNRDLHLQNARAAETQSAALRNLENRYKEVSRSVASTNEKSYKFFRDSETGALAMRIAANSVGDFDNSVGGAGKTVETAAEKLKKYIDASRGLTNAQRSARDSAEGLKRTEADGKTISDKLAAAKEKLRFITQGYGADSKEAAKQARAVSDAQRDLVKANTAVEDAVRGVAKAEDALKKLREKPSALTMENADIDLQQAKLNVEKANFDVLDAEKELADLRTKGDGTPEDIRKAEIRLQESKWSQREAVLAVTDAEAKLKKLREDTPTAEDIAAAERDLADAKLAVEDAVIAQGDATDRLNKENLLYSQIVSGASKDTDIYAEALAEVNALIKEQEENQRALVKAQEDLRDATLDLADAEAKLNEVRGQTPKKIITRAEGILNKNPSIVSGGGIQLGEFDPSMLDWSGISFFANGGVVTSPTLGLVGESGPEAIIPLSQMGSGMTVNVTVNAGMGVDPAVVGDEIVNVLQRYNRRNGALPLKVA